MSNSKNILTIQTVQIAPFRTLMTALKDILLDTNIVFTKEGRFATIYIEPKKTFSGFVSGNYGSDIDISVVHPDAIGIQNPYEDLNYKALPELP